MKLKFDLKNCYGIGELTHEIDYSANSIAVVYAPNGTMKTSLAKTFTQLVAGKEPCDDFYKARVSHASITIDETPINKDNTYVFQNEDADGTKQISTFLANSELKAEYDAIYQQWDDAKKTLKKKIRSLAKSSDCEEEIMAAFKTDDDDNYFDCLLRIREEIDGKADLLEGYDFKFNDVFEKNGRVKDFICENQDTIQRYFQKYTELIQASHFFSGKAKFGTSQANSLLKSVGDDRYFKAGHKFELGGEEHPRSISSKKDMEDVIKTETQRIFADEGIKEIFEDLEAKLDKNLSLKGFKDVIQDSPELIPELIDYDEFQRKILRGYLAQCEDEMITLTDLYLAKKEEVKDIVHRATAERSQWERVLDVFNDRFFVPFKLELQNKSDILLNAKAPELQFLYEDGGDAPLLQDRKTLIDHLSTGEKKAFFILQNIFELEARRVGEHQTLLVFDDIADSFDYKNKYAIVEYLNDLKKDGNFKILILTHNFDFYRTVVSRLECGGNIFFADKKGDRSVNMCKGIYNTDILKNRMLKNICDRRTFIGCIPFVRNIIEYIDESGNKSDGYIKLTKCLHLKDDTSVLTFNDIIPIFQRTIKSSQTVAFTFGADNYLSALMEEAEAIMIDPNEVEIVNKLVLSMAIRIKAEEYMNGVLTEDQLREVNQGRNRTAELLNIMKKYHSTDMESQCLEMNKVLMLTSENIHFNNFMFEPLVDISILHLKQLYNEVKALSEP